MMTLSIIVLIISVALALYSEYALINGRSIFGKGDKFRIGRVLAATVLTWCIIMFTLDYLAGRWLL